MTKIAVLYLNLGFSARLNLMGRLPESGYATPMHMLFLHLNVQIQFLRAVHLG